jgi:hypothetical protein
MRIAERDDTRDDTHTGTATGTAAAGTEIDVTPEEPA